MPTVAVLELTAHPDGGVTGRMVPPAEATGTPPAGLLLRICEHLHTWPGASKSDIETTIGGKAETVRGALAWLAHEDRGYVSVDLTGKGHRHTLTEKGRDLLDDLR